MAQYLGASTPVLDEICHVLIKESARITDLSAGAKVEGIGKGGHVLYVSPPGILWDRINQIIAKIKKRTRKDIWLDWASWIDGYGKEGLTLEQHISGKIYSRFVPEDSVRFSLWKEGKLSKSMIISNHEIDKNKERAAIFLDQIHNKIYLDGNQLTSREIYSALATVAILAKLLKSSKFQIKNRDLPRTYSHNRYDLQSKIVIPFLKSCKKYLDKDIDLKIHGEMYDNYSLTLNDTNLEVGLIETLTKKS